MKIKLQQAADVLQKADEVLVLSHKSPDGDTLGSASALCTALQRMGKHVRFACSDPVVPKYENLFAELKTEEFEPNFIVAVDIADTQLLGKETEQYKDSIDLAIDHHMSHKEYAKMSYVDSTAASTTQVIYELFCMDSLRFHLIVLSFYCQQLILHSSKFISYISQFITPAQI